VATKLASRASGSLLRLALDRLGQPGAIQIVASMPVAAVAVIPIVARVRVAGVLPAPLRDGTCGDEVG
jgi:hypothetical protein